MNTFDERGKAFERKYALDSEVAFKVNSRQHKLLGLWAAKKLGLTGDEAESYAKEVVMADFESPGPEDVIAKLLKDFGTRGIPVTEKDIRAELERCHGEARKQIVGAQ